MKQTAKSSLVYILKANLVGKIMLLEKTEKPSPELKGNYDLIGNYNKKDLMYLLSKKELSDSNTIISYPDEDNVHTMTFDSGLKLYFHTKNPTPIEYKKQQTLDYINTVAPNKFLFENIILHQLNEDTNTIEFSQRYTKNKIIDFLNEKEFKTCDVLVKKVNNNYSHIIKLPGIMINFNSKYIKDDIPEKTLFQKIF